MKVIWSNPVIWGYKHGYSVPEIAAGLMILPARVRKEIAAYEAAIIEGEIALRQNSDVLGKNEHVHRLGNWQRERMGARAALAEIEAAKLPLKAVRHGQ
jgi:hypothetical protein